MEKDGMVNSVKGSWEVQEQKKRWKALVSGHKQIVCDPDQSGLRTMGSTETRLEFFIETMWTKVIMNLSVNDFFDDFWKKWKVRDGPVIL